MQYKLVDHYKVIKPKTPKFPSTEDDFLLLKEENESAIDNLVNLTAINKISWNCTGYMPIDDMPADKSTSLYLWQSFDVETSYNGHVFKLELMETITLPAGRGDLAIDYIPDWQGIQGGGTSLSMKHDNYYKQQLSIISNRYKSDSITKLFELIIPNIIESQAVIEGFNSKYIESKIYNQSLLSHKLFKLKHHLRIDRRAIDFHKCIFDLEHREQLLKEYCID